MLEWKSSQSGLLVPGNFESDEPLPRYPELEQRQFWATGLDKTQVRYSASIPSARLHLEPRYPVKHSRAVMNRFHILITSVAIVVSFAAGYGQQRGGSPTTSTQGQKPANNQVFTSKMYGVSFTYASSYNLEPEHNTTYWAYRQNTDFTNQDGAVVLVTVEIPTSLYAGTNFEGGKFVVSVSPTITNRTACNQFASGQPSSSVSINGIAYSVSKTGGVGMGHYSDYSIFHTYQNRFCYEFMLEINTFNRGNLENPSSVQEFADARKIQYNFLSGISFFRPAAQPPSRSLGPPEILSFSASSPVAGVGIHNNIKFSWTSRNVDYVRLQYSCAKGEEVEDGVSPQCGTYSSSPNHSPNGSTRIIFGNNILSSPERSSIPVTVMLVPFANGVAYPNLSKSITITISPYNAFPEGVPTSDMNMSLTLSAGSNGEFRFARGSTVNIRWTDTNTSPPDSCVNLYLVQDNEEGGETYLYKLTEPCLSPGSGSGSYSWTIPGNFSGTGFRIVGAAPGGRAHALSVPFTIY